VDYRVVSMKPHTVNHLVASSMPLALITAWEALEEKFHIAIPEPNSFEEKLNASKNILIVAGAGGVGSIAIQLAKNVFKLGKVIATAGRADSAAWCRNMGADLVLDRTKDWKNQLTDAGVEGIDYIFSCAEVDDILDVLVAISHPWGHICGIVVNKMPLNMASLFRKSLSFSWEYMASRPIHHYQLERHAIILAQAAALVDKHIIKSWVGTTYDNVTLEGMRAGHILQQSGTAIGKIAYKAQF
jgi:NADPH2:quinone reductase